MKHKRIEPLSSALKGKYLKKVIQAIINQKKSLTISVINKSKVFIDKYLEFNTGHKRSTANLRYLPCAILVIQKARKNYQCIFEKNFFDEKSRRCWEIYGITKISFILSHMKKDPPSSRSWSSFWVLWASLHSDSYVASRLELIRLEEGKLKGTLFNT